MQLTDEQKKLVEQNHNLIYWYINKHRLDINEWYDLLAIELCYTVMKHDPKKGSLSNYFVLRADGLRYKEFKKGQAKKRTCELVPFMDNLHGAVNASDMLDEIEFNEWMDSESKEVLKLKSQGYSQDEIARELGVSQSYISKILKKAKENYYEVDR